jgi:low temperature requirement protein LtrA
LTGDFSAGFTIAREAALAAAFGAVLALVFAATFGAALLAGFLVDDFTATAFPFALAWTAVDLAAGFAAFLAEMGFTGADLVVFAEAVCFLAGFFIAVAMESSTTE